jgi:RNA polymerase sigma factor (sigma-70 family)
MANSQADNLLRHIRGLAGEGAGAPADGELLERFVARRDEEAFAELVRRHGPMVLGTCRGVLRHAQDAEDAFQATFLVLAKKASSVRRRSVGGWLHTVAYHLACRARARGARRQQVERRAEVATAGEPLLDVSVRELMGAVHEELSRLPEKYRAPLVLCYLQERTQDEAARQLGCTEGALHGRLFRGRERLRARLARRGLALPAGLSAFLLAHGLACAVPASLAEAAVRAARGSAPAQVAGLAADGLWGLSLGKARLAVVLMLALGALGLSASLLLRPREGPARGEPAQAPRGKEVTEAGKPPADVHGDPLPAGAVARLGTRRWRQDARTLAFSPDGRYLAAAGDTTRVFDARSGQLLQTLAAPSNYLFFAPDRKTLLTTPYGFTPTLRFWDLATGKELRKIPVVGGANFYPKWSADGKLMAFYCFQDGKGPVVSFWDMGSGKEVRSWVRPLGGLSAQQLALAPDGKTLALREQSAIHLFDVATGKELRRLGSPLGNVGHTLETPTVCFSPDGALLACTDKSDVRVWETATGRSRHHFPVPGSGAVSVCLSPDGRTLAAGVGKGEVHLWDLAAGKLGHTLAACPHGVDVYLLAFSPDGKRLATQAHGMQSIRLWDVASGKELPGVEGPATQMEGLAFAPDGKTALTVDSEGAVWLWDAAAGKLLRRFPGSGLHWRNHPQPVAVLPDGKILVRGHYESWTTTWDLASGKRLCTGKHEGKVATPDSSPGAELYPGCSPDGRTVAAVFPGELKRRIEPPARDRGPPPPPPTLIYWTMIGLSDARTGKMTRSFRVDAEHLGRLVLSPDRRLLAGVGQLPDNSGKPFIFVWDLARGRELRRMEIPALDGWNGVAFSADGRTLVSGAHHQHPGRQLRFHFWEVATGWQRAAVDCAVGASSAPQTAFAGDRLAALALDRIVHLVNPWTGKELKRLEGHGARVDHLAFSPDGRRLASGSRDTTGLVWDVAAALPARKNVQLSAKELKDCWADLAADDAGRAYRAVRLLARAPGPAAALIGEHLQPVPFPRREAVRRLLAALDSKQFAEREKATRELEGLGEVGEAALRELLKGRPSLEVRRRAEGILAKMKEAETRAPPVPTGEAVRALRALEVLEWAGTPEAERLLRRLADGAPHAALTQDARAAWQRLTGRPAASR